MVNCSGDFWLMNRLAVRFLLRSVRLLRWYSGRRLAITVIVRDATSVGVENNLHWYSARRLAIIVIGREATNVGLRIRY